MIKDRTHLFGAKIPADRSVFKSSFTHLIVEMVKLDNKFLNTNKLLILFENPLQVPLLEKHLKPNINHFFSLFYFFLRPTKFLRIYHLDHGVF